MAAKPRVHEIAAELGVDSKLALRKLREMGEFVKSPSSTIQPPVARKLRAALTGAPTSSSRSERPSTVKPPQVPLKPKSPRKPVLRRSTPSSDHPEDIAAHQRRVIIQRSEPDWGRFGFTPKERETWINAGVPEGMAQIAAMCRDSMKRSDSPARLLPANLRKHITEERFQPQMVIEALLSGEDVIRVQDRFAARLDVPPPIAGTELLRVLGATASVTATGIYGRCAAFASIDWKPSNLPKVAEAILDVLRSVQPHIQTLLDFESQVADYRESKTVSPLFAAFARAHGVFHVDENLDVLSETVLDHRDSYQSALHAIAIAESALTSRHFSHLHSETATSLVDAPALPFSPDTLLPSDDGIVFVDGTPSRIIFWTSTASGVTCFSVTSTEVSSMSPSSVLQLGSRIQRWEPDGFRASTSTTLSLLDALVAARELTLGRASKQSSGESRSAQGSPEIKAVVVSYRTPHPGEESADEAHPGVKLDHRVKVRAHPRNQFYPSTNEHKVIQIASYEKGPQSAPLILCDRVAVY